MNIVPLLFGTTIAVGLAISTGCHEPISTGDSLDSTVEEPSQAVSDQLEQSASSDGSPSESGQANSGADESNLRVDVDDEGVGVEVGDAVDVSVGKEGVDVDVRPNGKPKGNDTSESS